MNNRRFLVILGLILAAVLVWKLLPISPEKSAPTLPDITLNGRPLYLEIVSTVAEHEKGLGERDSLPENQGMLFVFNQPDRYGFWMKGMRFPLDIVWLKDGRVVDLVKNFQPPAMGQDPVAYTPQTAANRVLEINAGQAEAYGLTVGSEIIGLP